ncbi:MAG: dipicolinate synthase subunit DpsA [Ruminococcus sp.]|nr:dipicolinate synthase subunit DpsA [Ruminococcus sp.]
MSYKFIIAGGDMRFSALAEQLGKKYTVCAAGLGDNIAESENIKVINDPELLDVQGENLILPMPVSGDGITLNAPFAEKTTELSRLTSAVREGGTVFGGRITDNVRSIFAEKGFRVIDYLEREELAVLNARATAEGAVALAVSEQPVTIAGENILILGMGRISKCLVRILSGYGADMTAAARKFSDLAWAEVYGCKAVNISELEDSGALENADLIFNTVPHVILDRSLLEKCGKNCLIIDLASSPGGIDLQAAGILGLKAIHALSLPGKTAPLSAGRIIGTAIENILKQTDG